MGNQSTRKTTKKAGTRNSAKKSAPGTPQSASDLIDARIAELDDWRGRTLARVRALIKQAVPDVVEEVKWRKPSNSMLGVPVWSHDGIVCTGETYKDKVKLTFAKGAAVADPAGLFNSSLDGKVRRAIDVREGDTVAARSFKALVRRAAAHNASSTRSKSKKAGSKRRSPAPKLLSGGNPQIAKADGDAPVQAYIAAMPGWKQGVGRRLDALIVGALPDVRKAVRWNTPFYGVEGRGWFLGFHCFTKYVKVTFLRGSALRPRPPVASKDPNARYFHIHEDDEFDTTRITKWIRQAARLPGDPLF